VVTQAKVGDDVGLLLKDISNGDVQKGDIVAGYEIDFN
jgi:translation elongation factor EF-1alpha